MKAKKLAAVICSTLLTASATQAVLISGSELNNSSYFGTLGQLNPSLMVRNPSLIGPNACVPTATIDGLTYLENYAVKTLGVADPFKTSPNSYTQLGNLAQSMGTMNRTFANRFRTNNTGGTPVNRMYNGLQAYLSRTGRNPAPGVVLSGQDQPRAVPSSWYTGRTPSWAASVTPTASFLANALQANDGVEITVQWGSYTRNGVFVPSGGGHELTLDDISLNTANNTGVIGYLDPAGSATAATPFLETLVLTNGYLYFADPVPATDNRFGNLPGAGGGLTGRITADMVEALGNGGNGNPVGGGGGGGGVGGQGGNVPEGGSTALILGVAVSGLAGVRRFALVRQV